MTAYFQTHVASVLKSVQDLFKFGSVRQLRLKVGLLIWIGWPRLKKICRYV